MPNPKQWKILESLQLGKTTCKNRILMGPHSYGYVNDAGLPLDSLTDYVVERAKGGAGLIILGATAISHEGAIADRMMLNVDDRIVPCYQKIADEVHKYGALVFDQLMHAGGQIPSREGVRIVAPSPVPHEVCNSIPTELTVDEIKDVVNDFASAASRARVGKLDGVELKCDQGYLIHQFLSPHYNRRLDDYGGSFENRLRFLIEILEKVREATSDNFVLGLRITGDSMTKGDFRLDDAVKMVQAIEETGYADYIHVNGGTNSTYKGYRVSHGDSEIEPMNFSSFARAIKTQTKLPVIAASMILHPDQAEELISTNVADMVAMTRAHIADAEIVNKVQSGKIDDIRSCILCNQSCVGNHWNDSDVRCIYNAATGRERELGINTLIKASNSKKIMVVGGGPAGLEVARISAKRGHKVELFEKQDELGGQLILGGQLPFRQGLKEIVNYLEKEIKKFRVKINYGVNITVEDILLEKENFDAIVIATGSKLYIPPIYEQLNQERILTIDDMLRKDALGKHILVVDGDWRQNSLAVAEWLLGKNCEVTILSANYVVGAELDIVTRTSYYTRIHNKVSFLPLTTIESIQGSTVQLRNVLSNEITSFSPVDQIVFVTGALPNNSLYFALKDEVNNIFRVGDCVDARGIPEAVLAANRLGRIF